MASCAGSTGALYDDTTLRRLAGDEIKRRQSAIGRALVYRSAALYESFNNELAIVITPVIFGSK